MNGNKCLTFVSLLHDRGLCGRNLDPIALYFLINNIEYAIIMA